MNPDLITRFLIAAIISGAGVVFFLLMNRLVLSRVSNRVRTFKNYQAGRPAIVYFTTPTCIPCKTVQRPAIEALKKQMGKDLQVFEVDASQHPEIAQQWGVMSVPTTFIVDTAGVPRHVNHGVANLEKLNSQMEDFEI